MTFSQTIAAGLVFASSLAGVSAIGGPASAQPAFAGNGDPVVCWIEDRDREWSGSLLFFAGAREAGRYELTIRQNHGSQQLMAEQSGTFRGDGLRPTLLSSIFAGSRVPVEDVGLTASDASRAGNLTTIRAQRVRAAPELLAGRGYTARLQVFDRAGRRICDFLY
ncbi:MAG: hypothetical protein ACK4NO_07890 [Glycocaulis sp.]